MFCFFAIAPHAPVLAPTIGKDEAAKKAAKTLEAIQDLEEKLYLSKPETIIIISPHGNPPPGTFVVEMNKEYNLNLKEFGDFKTKKKFLPNSRLLESVRHRAIDEGIPVGLETYEKLNYGAAIPLLLLTANLPKVKIIPINTADLDLKTHFEFGKMIREAIAKSGSERVAVIASADLSDKLRDDSPGGFSPRGKEFDETVLRYIETKNVTGILGMDADIIKDGGGCGLKSIVTLLGAMDKINCEPQTFSYEAPFGIGLLVEHFKLQ
ncbi:MAG: class III extradiol dioxygenase subunit B-like domain-containing protein [Patescibacteria group bacterium]